MRQSLIVLAVLLLAVSFSTINTNAQTQVVLFPSTSGQVTFSSGGLGSVAMCTSSCTLTSSLPLSAVIGSGGSPVIGSGTYTLNFGAASLTQVGTNFTVASGGTETLTYTDTSGGGGSVTMTLQLTLVKDNTSAPQLSGTYVVTSSTGNLTSLFSGSNAEGTWNLTLNLGSSCTLDGIAAETCSSTTGRIAIGSTLAATPEPSSMLLFGTGLLAFGVILRRRLT